MSKKTSKLTRREKLRAKHQRKKVVSRIIWGSIAALGSGLILFFAWQILRPAVGEEIPVPSDYQNHIQVGSLPGPYPSDPPAGGRHYGQDLPAGFYEDSDLERLPEFPEGYLVHNLEHGYVIFWYNCDVLSVEKCSELKSQIRDVMDEFNGIKLIAFPWKTIEDPVVMTSWGRLQRFETFNKSKARSFVSTNRNRAPEPNAP